MSRQKKETIQMNRENDASAFLSRSVNRYLAKRIRLKAGKRRICYHTRNKAVSVFAAQRSTLNSLDLKKQNKIKNKSWCLFILREAGLAGPAQASALRLAGPAVCHMLLSCRSGSMSSVSLVGVASGPAL